jgi:acyl-CoA dehydrogenase
MTPATLLDTLFQSSEPAFGEDLRGFLKRFGPGVEASGSMFERLVAVAIRADRRLTAGAAGHQAAIRRLFPQTPDDAIAAFCVSEEQGPKPAAILSALTQDGNGFRLNGSKKWGSMSPLADVLYVAASIGFEGGRNRLRMVRLSKVRDGVQLDTSAYGRFAGHMPIADIALSNVAVAANEVIEADAYDAFIKPFRLVEDCYNTVGVQIGLLQLGRRQGWAQDVLEDLTGLIVNAHAISQTPMSRAQDVVLMAGYFKASEALWNRLGPSWSKTPDDVRRLWNPEAGTLGVAARAREQRRVNSWAELG